MKTRLLLFMLMFCLATTSVVGQGIIKREKCKTCGKVITLCPYKGKHPAPKPKQETKPKAKPRPQPVPKPEVVLNDKTFSVGGVEFVMKPVEGGTFTMGATSEQQNPDFDEKPTYQVTLSSYYIGETEVTQALWAAVMGNNPSHFKGDNNPVEQVSWDDCLDFITKLNSLTGKKFRLPTEAEWEYAARGGNKSMGYQYSGSNNLDDVAWYTNNSYSETHIVKTKQPNELGIYDMSGNVWEWCQDWYGDYSSSSQTNPQGPSTGSGRVHRGGSWDIFAWGCRSALRSGTEPDARNMYLGLRLVLSETVGFAQNYDLNGDGSVNSSDVVVLYNYIASGGNSGGGGDVSSQTFTVNGVSFNMISVEGGTFQMGATAEQENPDSNESPVHSVTLSSFAIGETEVTQALWKAVTGYSPTNGGSFWSSEYGIGDDYPAYYVSWNDCQQFITKLNSLTGKKFRLPTEAEWEYAARGGNKSKGYQYSGSNNIDYVAWCWGDSGHPVKTKQPNELGIYDMSGNVWEWCQDWYGYYSTGSQTNPQGPSTGFFRVIRGGAWGDSAWGCRSAFRYYGAPGSCDLNIGLRLVLSE